MQERIDWQPGLGAVIYIEVTAEDLTRLKPIEVAAKRKFDKPDTWTAHTGLWFGWVGWTGQRVRYAYECTLEALRDFQADPRPCVIRYERLIK